jgi:hypothetical protein
MRQRYWLCPARSVAHGNPLHQLRLSPERPGSPFFTFPPVARTSPGSTAIWLANFLTLKLDLIESCEPMRAEPNDRYAETDIPATNSAKFSFFEVRCSVELNPGCYIGI